MEQVSGELRTAEAIREPWVRKLRTLHRTDLDSKASMCNLRTPQYAVVDSKASMCSLRTLHHADLDSKARTCNLKTLHRQILDMALDTECSLQALRVVCARA